MKVRRFSSTFIKQHDQSDCGVACLASVIKYHGGDPSIQHLRELSGTNTQGTTLLGLYHAALQLGFDAEGLEANSIDDLKELSEPAIMHVIIENRLQHFIVFYKFNSNGSLLIGDPAKGISSYSKSEIKNIWQSKALIKLMPNQKFKKNDKDLYYSKRNWIKELLIEDYSILIIAFSIGVILSLLNISTAIFSQKLIDDIIPQSNSTKLINSLLLLSLLLLTRSGLSYFRGLLLLKQSMEFNLRITNKFYNIILNLPKIFFDTHRIGELIARLNDTRRIQAVIATVVGNILIDVLLVVAALTVSFFYSTTIGIVITLCIPVYILIIFLLNNQIFNSQREVMAGYALTESHYMDSLQGISTIKSKNCESFFENMNKKVYGYFQTKTLALGKLNLKLGLFSDMAGVLIIISIFGFGSWLIMYEGLKLGAFVALMGISGSAIPSIIRVSLANVQIQEAKVAFSRMFEFTAIESEDVGINEVGNKILIDSVNRNGISIKINRLNFRFPGRKTILKDVSFELNSGEMVAIKGESGGGKSTLIQILQKFYQPWSGDILVNGVPWQEIPRRKWRSYISVVPQDVKIFNGDLLFNITLSDDPKIFEEAINFCHKWGFDKYFRVLPHGYATVLGEDGINISGGQKQLMAFVRALLTNPKLLLLDEATSSMDDITENFILSILEAKKGSMTTLLVTHRKEITSICDRSYILENGILKKDTSDADISSLNL